MTSNTHISNNRSKLGKGFTLHLGDDWDILAKAHIRTPRPYARMGLKPEELGLITWLLSHKPGQPLSAAFAAEGMSCSVDRINAICKRLEARDILHRHRDRDERGRLGDAIWELIPPPEFRELARALAAAEGEPKPENPILGTTSENIHSGNAKPQVGTKMGISKTGKTKAGKSGAKVVQEKGSSKGKGTHTAGASESAGAAEDEADTSVCVDASQENGAAAPKVDDEALAIVRAVAAPVPNLLATATPPYTVPQMTAAVRSLLDAGWTTKDLMMELNGLCNERTIAPASRIGPALVALADKPVPVVRRAPVIEAPSDEERLAAEAQRAAERDERRRSNTRTPSAIRAAAAKRAVELGAEPGAAERWAKGQAAYKLHQFLESDHQTQKSQIPIARATEAHAEFAAFAESLPAA